MMMMMVVNINCRNLISWSKHVVLRWKQDRGGGGGEWREENRYEGGSRNKIPRFLDLDTRWRYAASFTLCSPLSPRKKAPYRIFRKLVGPWIRERYKCDRKKLLAFVAGFELRPSSTQPVSSPHACYISHPSHSSWHDHSGHINKWRVEIRKLFVM
jgi:hypothetical protein